MLDDIVVERKLLDDFNVLYFQVCAERRVCPTSCPPLSETTCLAFEIFNIFNQTKVSQPVGLMESLTSLHVIFRSLSLMWMDLTMKLFLYDDDDNSSLPPVRIRKQRLWPWRGPDIAQSTRLFSGLILGSRKKKPVFLRPG